MKRTNNSAGMKYYNRQAVLNIIRKKALSRAELSRVTGLTRAAISLIVDELIGEGFIIEVGTGDAELGRKPVLLDLKPDCRHAVGLNISRGGCNAGIVNMKGKVVAEKEIQIKNLDMQSILKESIKNIKSMVKALELDWSGILGIGVSSPGPLDIISGTILNPPNFGMWHNVNIVNLIKKEISTEVFLENNSNAFALAEKNFGLGILFKSFVLLMVDTGVGAGIVLNDRIYRGVGGFSSEIGHTTIDFNGRQCSCGNKGCLEAYSSIPAILKEAERHDPGIKTWNDVVDKALKGDKLYDELIEKEARYLSAGIVNTVNILEPEAVILNGFISYKPETLIERIRKYLKNTAITRSIHEVQILNSDIKEHSEIISAASIVIDMYFNGRSC